MKLNRRFVTKFVASTAAVAAVFLLGSVQAQNAQPQKGRALVTFVQGSASISKAGGAFQPLQVNQVVEQGDTLRTDPNSHVDLTLGKNNGGIVQVSPGTTVGFDKLVFNKVAAADVVFETQMNLSAGTIYGKVPKMSAGSKYEVKTPRGVAGIRGTAYRISSDGSITVTEGTIIIVIITATGPQTFTVNEGNTFNPGLPPGQELRPATPDETRSVQDAIADAVQHTSGTAEVKVFVAPVINPFVSPTTGPSQDVE